MIRIGGVEKVSESWRGERQMVERELSESSRDPQGQSYLPVHPGKICFGLVAISI